MEPPYLHSSFAEQSTEGVTYPGNARCPVLLTHDVETAEGLSRIEDIRKIEREFGAVSTWNFVLDKYGDVSEYVKKLTDEGCECGAHGLYHDGLLFRDRNTYEERMKRIVDISSRLNLKGFRSPSLHRNRDWMQDMPFEWDSSFPAWDPFQPQPGGCERYEPFMLSENTIELPVTLWQDFTLFEELQQNSIDIWKKQIDCISHHGGLINVIVHPDYINHLNLRFYQDILQYCVGKLDNSITCPSELRDMLEGDETTFE